MNTIKLEMATLKELKSYKTTYLNETVKASSLYKNANTLYNKANTVLWTAAEQIWSRYQNRINCSYCGLEAIKGNPCPSRVANELGHLPEVNWISKSVNRGPSNLVRSWNHRLGEMVYRWPTTSVEVQNTGGCQITGGHYQGAKLGVEAIRRDAEGQDLSVFISNLDWEGRQEFL